MNAELAASPPGRPPLWPRLLAVPVVVAITLLGLWVAGGVITDDFRASMGLSALWFALAFAASAAIAWRQRSLAWPVLGTFLVTAGAVAVYLGYATLVDRVVNEQVVVATAPGNSAAGSGAFTSAAHETRGTATVVELADGRRLLTLTDFATDPGPDLRVYLAPAPGNVSGAVDLGALKGNRGNQQYAIPAGLDLAALPTVIVWCRAFSVEFGSARLAGVAP
ncbi:MAG TPA: DM13 domain-containing protein [Gaiellaceae bacterium]|nr:DM13 domain-containing protein [Gaiellaceae bacterium]